MLPENDPSPPVPAPAVLSPSVPVPTTPWTLRNLGVFLASALLALISANLLVFAGYAALRLLTGLSTPTPALRDNPFFLLSLQCVFYGLLLGTMYLFLVVNHHLPFWATLQWRAPTTGRALQYFLGGILLAAVVQLAPSLLPDREDFPLTRLFTSPQAGYAIAAFAVLVAPLMEELIFRGILFSFFEYLIGNRFAVAGTAALFAALHVSVYWGAWNHVFLILLVGLVFSATRGLTGSLVPSVILHAAYNASLMTTLFVQTQHFRALQPALVP